MKRLAVIVARGEYTAVLQAVTLLMAAVGSGLAVRVFFRDDAVYKVTARGARELNLGAGYAGREAEVRARLAAQGLDDLGALLAAVKDAGDVRLWVCSSSAAIAGVGAEDLLPAVDGLRGLTAFLLEDVAEADRVLTF